MNEITDNVMPEPATGTHISKACEQAETEGYTHFRFDGHVYEVASLKRSVERVKAVMRGEPDAGPRQGIA